MPLDVSKLREPDPTRNRAERAAEFAESFRRVNAQSAAWAESIVAQFRDINAGFGRMAALQAAQFAEVGTWARQIVQSQAAQLAQMDATARHRITAGFEAAHCVPTIQGMSGVSEEALKRLSRPWAESWTESMQAQLAAIAASAFPRDEMARVGAMAANMLQPLDVSQQMRDTFAGLEAVGKHAADAMREMRWTGPIGDLIAVYDAGEADEERYRAARRLAEETFTFRYVFARERRAIIKPAFLLWKRERSWSEAWVELVTSLVFIAVNEQPDGLPVSEAFRRVRCFLRREIEVELFGCSTDSRAASEVPLADDWEPPDASEILELAFVRLDLLLALKRLPTGQATVLLAYYADGADRRALAASLGITYAALRKRVERIRDRLAAGVEVAA